MADLAKTRTPIDSRNRGTRNRDYTIPSRRETRAPSIEVNAPLATPNQSEAQKLADLLGVAADAGNAAVGLARQRDARQREEVRAQAGIDATTGTPSDQLGKSEVYTRSFYEAEGVRQAATLDAEVTMAVNNRLAETDDPATPEDIMGIIDQSFRAAVMDEEGNLTPMHPAKQMVLANQMSRTKARLIGPALQAIQEQNWTQYADNAAFDVIKNGLPEVGYVAPEGGLTAPAARVPTALEEVDPNVAFEAPKQAPVAKLVTGRLPIQGAVTSNFSAHTSRGSPGLDIDGRKGDPVELPASGTVIETGYNQRAGNYVIVDHGNGVVTSYSHLDKRHVKMGDAISAGEILGTVGNSGNVRSKGGDGSHLHYRVKVNGEDVDPQSFTFDGIDPAATPEARLALVEQLPKVQPPALDFEVVMERRPPGMSPKAWKEKMIPALVLHAEVEGRPEILDGLWQSVRKDGTPSFNPAEIEKLRGAADEIRTKMRQTKDREERELHEGNENQILDAFSRGENVSIASLNEAGEKGLISPRFRYQMIEGIRTEAEQEQRYQDALEREAEREAKQDRALTVAGLITARSVGLDLPGSDGASDYELWQSGALGEGAEGISNFRQLRSAAERGRRFLLEQPEYVNAAEAIRRAFPRATTGGSMLDQLLGSGGQDNQALALSIFQRMVGEGKSPAEAVAGVRKEMKQYTSDSETASVGRLAELRRKASQ